MEIKTVPLDIAATTAQNQRTTGKKAAGVEPDAKTRASAKKVATEFEAMFAGMMLKSMRSSLSPNKLTGGGHGEEVFQSMLDQEYASAIAKQGSLGIGSTIEKQLLEDARRQGAARRNASGKP
ncbi:rod-binding protein [Geobacter pelophilus]|jgi:flagellar protein FlgJ|uniref:Rod-binding protein n=1 Tax=Geoanaerobacter pelophilus TaxID=60036 RepID=A0AAW4L2B4_9BACT|nr:rod-binding protein [Geoanaerobacter pelophilus]MBT0663945.1 rod-binding protein [Geoanaerobacter pelophilus]